MADEEVVSTDVDEPDDAELEASEIVTDDKGNKTVSLSTMLRYKKEAKALGKKVKELEPVAQRVTELDAKLEAASPFINAIVSNPKLKAEALRAVNGTRASGEATDQPDSDPEAEEFAEISNMYLADGQTLDVARAKRAMAILDKRHGRQTDERLRPLAGSFLGDRASTNVQRAIAEVDADGVPIASKESIDEVVNLMGRDGQHLLANPQVIDMILNQAAGLDRRKGRTPKAVDEPLYVERQGGRGGRKPVVDADTRASLDRLGLTVEEYTKSNERYEKGTR